MNERTSRGASVEIAGLRKSFGDKIVLDGVNLGVFGFGTESPPRQFLLHVKLGF